MESKLQKIDELFQQAVRQAKLGELTDPLQAIIEVKDLLGVEQMDQADVYGLVATVLQNDWQHNEGR